MGRRPIAACAAAVCAAALLSSAAPAGAAGCSDATLALNAQNAPQVEAAIVCLVNEERAKRKRKSLTRQSTLAKVARAHSTDMGKKGYFSHDNQQGKTPRQRVTAAGYKGTYIAENVGFGLDTATAMVATWMNSSQHRANILSKKATQIGLGAFVSDRGNLYTAVFGRSK
jgi:uncharacterized protein YkwD